MTAADHTRAPLDLLRDLRRQFSERPHRAHGFALLSEADDASRWLRKPLVGDLHFASGSRVHISVFWTGFYGIERNERTHRLLGGKLPYEDFFHYNSEVAYELVAELSLSAAIMPCLLFCDLTDIDTFAVLPLSDSDIGRIRQVFGEYYSRNSALFELEDARDNVRASLEQRERELDSLTWLATASQPALDALDQAINSWRGSAGTEELEKRVLDQGFPGLAGIDRLASIRDPYRSIYWSYRDHWQTLVSDLAALLKIMQAFALLRKVQSDLRDRREVAAWFFKRLKKVWALITADQELLRKIEDQGFGRWPDTRRLSDPERSQLIGRLTDTLGEFCERQIAECLARHRDSMQPELNKLQPDLETRKDEVLGLKRTLSEYEIALARSPYIALTEVLGKQAAMKQYAEFGKRIGDALLGLAKYYDTFWFLGASIYVWATQKV